MKKVTAYLIITFVLAWGMQLTGVLSGNPTLYSVLVSACMFTPLLAVLITHKGLKKEKTGIEWKPRLRGNIKWYLLAWFSPAVLTVVGATVYFLLFPGRFDPGMGYMTAQLPAAYSAPAWLLVGSQFLSAVTVAPFINMIFAMGEEAGWRGFMTPALIGRFGRKKGMLLSGVIWAAFHYPLILLAGYEYGTGYWGAPWTGLVCMILFTTAMGVVLSWLYERTGSIWPCALCHGALNAVAALPLLFLPAGSTGYLLGPTIAGAVAGLPLFLWAEVLLRREQKP